MTKKIIIGKEEWCAFPELGLPAVKARVDSGAKTSSLHAFNIHSFEKNGEKFVRFDIHPIQKDRHVMQRCTGKIIARRDVKSSSGDTEKRHVILTPITLGEETWEIEVTLTNRDSMGYRMLLGREAMQGRVLIDPEFSFQAGELADSVVKNYYKAGEKPANS